MAPLSKITAVLSFSLLIAAQGTQFITGPCSSDADCASGCCGFNTGKCAGAVVALERDGGCGFGSGTPNSNAAQAMGFNVPISSGSNNDANTQQPAAQADPTTGAGNGQGTQFITGPCSSDADCAAGCCGFNSGKCAGPVIAQERDGGCGFGDAQPNDDAARALQGRSAQVEAGNGQGLQFITGACSGDNDCASGCCGFNTAKCAGPVVAQERDGGCGFGNAVSNDNAAQALQGRNFGRRGASFM